MTEGSTYLGNSSANKEDEAGVCSEGLITMVLPAAIADACNQREWAER